METPRTGSTAVEAKMPWKGLQKNRNRGVDSECGDDEASK